MNIQRESLILGNDMSSGVTVPIFVKKFAKMRQREQLEVQENSSENKASVWSIFKNFFACLTGMKKLIFYLNKFFCSSHFLIHQILKNYQKMTRAKKFVKVKNQLFHACQPCKGIFEIRSYWAIIFRAVFLNFQLLPLSHFCKFFAENWHSDSWGHIIS